MAVNLKLGDRLAIIRDGVKKGYTPQEAMLQYQINKDGGYNNWKNQFKLTTGINPDLDDTYNYELFFKENPEAAKQLIQGKVSPDILQMYKTPLAIQRERQTLLQKRNNINSLMDYSQYEKLINDYMNKSVNILSYGGPINIYAEGTQDLNTDTTTEVGLTPSQWRTTKSPDTIQVTPEELKSFKRVLMNIPENILDVPEDYRNLPQNTRFIQVPWEFIESISPDSKRPADDSESTTYYILEDIDDLNPLNYYTIHRLREHSPQGRAYDYWKKEQAWEDRQNKEWLYNYGNGEQVNIGSSEVLPEVTVEFDPFSKEYIVDPSLSNELAILGTRPINYEAEPSLMSGQGSSEEHYYNPFNAPDGKLNVPNNNPYGTEGVSGGSSFGSGAEGIKMPDVFDMNSNLLFEDLQWPDYLWEQEDLEYLNPPGYVPIPNWDVALIYDTDAEGVDFADFMMKLAGYDSRNNTRDLLMQQLMQPKDYFADPYAGNNYNDARSFYDAYNNDPFTKIQRESNGIPLYANGGRINKFEVGGEPSIEELALLRATKATAPKANYHQAIDFVYSPVSAMKMAYDKGVSNCTLTASLFYDPKKPIARAKTITTTPHVAGFYEVGEDYAIPGSMVIASLPNGNDYGKNSYHTMILNGYADKNYQFPFKGKVYNVKKGDPLVNYSIGKREPENYIKNIPLSAYLDNSDGKTNVRYYRPYNEGLRAKLLPEIIVTPNGNSIAGGGASSTWANGGKINIFGPGEYKNKLKTVQGGIINKFDGSESSYIQTPWYDPWKGNPIGRQVAENNARQLQLFQLYLDEYAKRLNDYINASNNWEYRDIEGDYPIATNIWTKETRIPIYKIPGSAMLKAFPNYTWNNGLTFEPNINYYTIRNAKGLYALIPQGSYISELMDLSFERDKALHPTKIAAADMTALVANIPIQHGIVPTQKKQEVLVLAYPLQALLWLDTKSDYEHELGQNMREFNDWYTNYLKQQQLENTIRDMMFRPVTLTNYIRATGDTANGDDSWLGSFFDPNKHGMWFGLEGRAFLLNHPLVAGLLDFGVDVLGAKTIKPISNFASNVRGFRTPSITRNPNYYYRQGVGLIEDARQSGVIRAGVNPLTGRLDFQFPFFQKGTLHYGDSKWAPDIILNKGKGDFEWQPVNSVGFVKPGQLDYNMRTPLVNGQTNMADASLFSTLKPVRFGKRTIGYIEKPLMKNNNTFTPTLNSTDLKQPAFTYDPITGYTYTGFNKPMEFGPTFNTPIRVSISSGSNKPTFKEKLENALNRYFFIENKNSYTRGIGMGTEGIEDIFKTGVIRGNPRGTERSAKEFMKGWRHNREHFKDIMKDTGIEGIESKFLSRTLTEEEFNAIKKAAKKYEKPEPIPETTTYGKKRKITIHNWLTDPLYDYETYDDYVNAINETLKEVSEMPKRVASGEIKPNVEQTGYKTIENVGLPTYTPIEERFGPNSDYVADGHPLSYWYSDGRNPITKGHQYALSNYGVRVNNPEIYTPFYHNIHLHPSFLRTPKLTDPSVELFGKGPFGITLKLDKTTGKPLIKEDFKKLFKRQKGKRK